MIFIIFFSAEKLLNRHYWETITLNIPDSSDFIPLTTLTSNTKTTVLYFSSNQLRKLHAYIFLPHFTVIFKIFVFFVTVL